VVQVISSSFLAGFSIGIGGMVFVSLSSAIAGAFVFSRGRFLVCHNGWALYTGRMGLLPGKGLGYVPELALIYVGNLLGTLFIGLLMHCAAPEAALLKVQGMVQAKLALPVLQLAIRGFMCGLLMYVAVTGFKTISDPVGKHLSVVLPVMVFILSGYEHCIADLFYFFFALQGGADAAVFSVIALLANLVGGCFVPVVEKFSKFSSP
jgi:formate/nitrite transporter FocA (FNT family)